MTAFLIYLAIGSVFGSWLHVYHRLPILIYPISVVLWPFPLYVLLTLYHES